MKHLFIIIALILISAGISCFPRQFLSNAKKSSEITKVATSASILAINEEAVVARVIDGDTIELTNGQRVRYIGIDTPELADPQKPVECPAKPDPASRNFAQEAAEENRRLVEGKSVRLEQDISDTDTYGRLLRYVFVGDVFINDYLVRQGFAHASTFPPDVAYQDQLSQAEKEAREHRRGLWDRCL